MASNMTFRGVELGDYCDGFSVSYGRDIRTVILPRANGARLYNHGGGIETIPVSGWVKKNTVKEAQAYLDALHVTLTNQSGNLVANGITYTNCLMTSFSFDNEDSNYRTFSCTFMRSAY